jgi:hypothetical protein
LVNIPAIIFGAYMYEIFLTDSDRGACIKIVLPLKLRLTLKTLFGIAVTSAQLEFHKYLHDHGRAQPHGNIVHSDTSSNEKDNMEHIEQSRV